MEIINISSIKKEVMQLNNLIEDYELNFLNLYNEVSKTSNNWKDAHATSFYKDLELKKIKVASTIDELKNVKDIYKYIQEKYELLGKKIEFNLNYKSKVLNNLNNYIEQTKEIIYNYESLDLSFCPYEAKYIRNEVYKLKQNKNKLIEYKNNITKKFDYIDEIEKSIKQKISKIEIETLQESDISKFI